MRILEPGAYGVICPIPTPRAQAEALVAACKYPPRGYRSFGPVRASIYAGSDYVEHANDDIVIMPMIETAEALKNLDAILSTPGVDAVYVGPADLSLALGCRPRLDQTDAPVVEAQQRIAEACKRHGVVAGIHNATAAYALKMIAAGYQFVTLASDSRHLAAKAAEEAAGVSTKRPTDFQPIRPPGISTGRVVRTNASAPRGKTRGSVAIDRPGVSGTPRLPTGVPDSTRKNTYASLYRSTRARSSGWAS